MKLGIRWFFLFLPGLCVFSSVLCAEIVTEVGADGALTLESGKQVVLAGIQIDTEGISVLRVLAQKQDLRLQLIANSAPGKKELAYAYLKAKCLRFPAKPNEIPGEQEVLINEFLVKIGAAKVIETQDFSHKAKFLKVQEEARRKGEGIWSYEVS
ncbi:MAG: thermonuclease family protein [Candidatus Omnitrophota bacterium]|jgi:endonuclease YncB( thermonuclease family)